MDETFRFTAIKYTGKSVELVWGGDEPDGHGTLDHVLKNAKEAPHKDFIEALQALGPAYMKAIRGPKHWQDNIDIRSCTLQWEDDGIAAFTISGVMKVERSNRPQVMNSPLWEAGEHPSLLRIMTVLVDEAYEYAIGRKREQLSLALADGPPDDDPNGGIESPHDEDDDIEGGDGDGEADDIEGGDGDGEDPEEPEEATGRRRRMAVV